MKIVPSPVFPERNSVAAKKKNQPEVLGFLGVGVDNQDEHQRLTRTKHFLLVGGSEETHQHMQEVTIRFNESLDQRGKRLQDATAAEVVDLMRKAMNQ
jgi:hypothetical protein